MDLSRPDTQREQVVQTGKLKWNGTCLGKPSFVSKGQIFTEIMNPAIPRPKILVVIASHGRNNDQYLHRLIAEYRTMPYEIDIVVTSNIPKDLDKSIEVVVGLPSKNPWTLPFAHKKIFAERAERYDLYIYTEDDTLITERHIEAFRRATEVLRPDEIAGFMRSEQGPDGTIYYSTVHSHYHWDPHSVCTRGDDAFAYFTNEHGACYILTKDQLRRAISSGGFLVPPHHGKYGLLETAATDPYTQCGFKKLVCISRLEDFTCKHLPNKYIGRTGLEKSQVDAQIRTLLEISKNEKPGRLPIRVESRLPGTRWTKFYYERCREDLLGLIPDQAARVLSIGCGWGKTEGTLVERGVHVTAVPLDTVIGALAKTRGIEVVDEGLESAPARLAGQKFDVLLITGLLHLIDDPAGLLRQYRGLLSDGGLVIATCPNVNHLAIRIRRLRGQFDLRGLEDYQTSGVHRASRAMVADWLASSGFSDIEVRYVVAERWRKFDRWTLNCAPGLWAEEFIAVGRIPGRPDDGHGRPEAAELEEEIVHHDGRRN